jgi:hypothetical protein
MRPPCSVHTLFTRNTSQQRGRAGVSELTAPVIGALNVAAMPPPAHPWGVIVIARNDVNRNVQHAKQLKGCLVFRAFTTIN